MTELDNLIRQRASVKSKLTIFSKFVTNLSVTYPDSVIADEHARLELEQRLERALDLINKFDDIQSRIEIVCENFDQQYIEQENFQASFHAITSKAKHLLTKNILQSPPNLTGAGPQRSQHADEHKKQNIKLPTIQLKKFHGYYDEWLEFRDTFDSLIHKNEDITNIQKFHYLRASLEGGASQIIQSLEFSSENYHVAWKLICERYNNPRILVNNHVKALFNLEQIREESPKLLRKMIDNITKHLRALQTLNEPTQHWDTLVIYLATTKLDQTTAREWEETKSSLETPSLDDLKSFLKNRSDLLESLEQNKGYKHVIKSKPKVETKAFFTSKPYCLLCKKEHYIQNCPDFIKLTAQERLEQVKKVKACINCLRSNHTIKECRASFCKHCKRKHNSMLHFENSEIDTESEAQSQAVCLTSRDIHNSQVVLATAQVCIYDQNNKQHQIRALLDAGSQSSFITEDICNLLNLPVANIDIQVSGLNQACASIKLKTTANIKSRINNFNMQVTCLVVPQITNELPNFKIDLNTLNIPQHIKLADPTFNKPNKIDLLLGADCFWELMCIGQVRLNQIGPILQKTRFGWIISGCVPAPQVRVSQCNLNIEQQINHQLERFWTAEEITEVRSLSREERECELHFLENVKRNSDGRFIVTIPLKDNPNKLGDSYTTAKNRLLSLERKFEKNPKFKEQYCNFMSEYMSLGHMVKLINDEHNVRSYYMPHHGVIKETSTTTKLRVVFDASAVTSSGVSLNNIQMVGPTVQQDLLSLLIRFRKHNYVVASDIEKMYRMVQVDPSQRSLQRIIWRDDSSKPIDTYELTTVTYGTASAAYLAIRCLYQIGVECSENSPRIANVIKNDFYVDDLLTGADKIEDAIQIANDISRELEKGCFKLRKWVSNSTQILQSIETNDTSNIVNFGVDENNKTLGLIWNGRTDMLSYDINCKCNRHVTKRTILSETSQIFDPLGLLSPCIIISKIILQLIWHEGLSWDEALPAHIHAKWLEFRKELAYLNTIKIPRQVTRINSVSFELHGFADASQQAYGACVYLRCRDQNDDIFVNLVCAKSKVAPIKPLTIPRLELSAAVLLVNLLRKVKISLDIEVQECTYWTDSTIVLGWINTSPNQLQTFVANRVVVLQDNSKSSEWKHVRSEDNPADHISRGVKPSLLPSLDIYWRGPNWLSKPEAAWPQTTYHIQDDLPELRRVVYTHKVTIEIPDFDFTQFSNLTRLERVIAYCLRFKANCFKTKENRNYGPLTFKEIRAASLILVKLHQRQTFAHEIESLSDGGSVDSKGKLCKLNPFLDQDKILRVGGRLTNSNFSYDKKFPILLRSNSHFTRLLFEREHKILLHAGPQLLLSCIRDRFWPIHGRNLARKVVNQCVKCFKVKPRTITPMMGDLPKTRLNPAPPFFTTGVDYAGPFLLRDKRGRGCKVSKCYVSIFVCFLTRAIHLELVSDLTTEAFIAALRRFIARRGKPNQMLSDNGTNFVGANSEIRKLGKFLGDNSVELTTLIENEGISWSFIPPHSPHFGGLWEAGVKSSKYHLIRVAGKAKLTFEQFYTLLTQVEAVLNSRPLTPLSCDPSDFTPLTPSHFLIGRAITSIADPDITHINENRLSHFQQIQRLQQHFWARWSREYVSELQQRCKWHSSKGNIQVDDLVVIKEDNQPPLKWSLGRVITLHPTSAGIIKRSFAKICPLPQDVALEQ